MRKLLRFALLVAVLGTLPGLGAPLGAPPASLDVYFLDMGGGAATLIVTPTGESILIDTGMRREDHRDAERIVEAARAAGLDHIDHLITTHFHLDHFGGLPEVARRIPVGTFYDKGAPPPAHERETDWYAALYPAYQNATAGRLKTLATGDTLALRQAEGHPLLSLRVVASEKRPLGFEGDVNTPTDDTGPALRDPDRSDNANSIAVLLTFGDFRFFAGGDLTWNVEHHLVYPENRIGQVDLFQVTHHGLDQSNNMAFLQAIAPTVAVALNGPKKGIQPQTFATLKALPSLQAIYQLNYNVLYGEEGNTAPARIANAAETAGGAFVKASVFPTDGYFTVQARPDAAPERFSIRPKQRTF